MMAGIGTIEIGLSEFFLRKKDIRQNDEGVMDT
jgi:hypothetical protein